MPETQRLAVQFIDAAWVGWAVLWVALSRDVKRTLRQEPVMSRMAHLLPLAIAAELLFYGIPGLRWLNGLLLPRATWMAMAGAALVAAGLGFSVWARLIIGRNWSGTVTIKQAHALVQSGAYALARHPIYTGLLTAFLGTAIAIDAARGFVALALVALAFLRKMRMEEMYMVEVFGNAYAAYRARTAALVPFVW